MTLRVVVCTMGLLGCSTGKQADSAGDARLPAADDTGFRDSDGDGHPDVADCGPADPSVYPGAPERCNRIDDDCDGSTDEDAVDASTVWDDLDGDGYGDPTTAHSACAAGPDEATRADDCDDTDADVHPAAREVCWSGKDDDCDGSPGECGPSGAPTTAALTSRWAGAAADALGTSTVWSPAPDGGGTTVLVSGLPGHDGGAGGVALLSHPLAAGGTPTPAVVGTGVDGLGAAVVAVGDVSGDGYPDVIAGATGARGARGAAILLLGGPHGLTPDGSELLGARPGDALGAALAGGDLNGDGHVDLAVGVPTEVSGGLRGGVAVVLGPLSELGGTLDTAAAWVEGTTPGGSTGRGLALDGDVNGDGLADLVVGAPRDGAGRVGIWLGPVSGVLAFDDADRRYDSDGLAYDVGRSVAWAGDTDDDGTDDLLVTAPLGSLDGAVLLFSGSGVAAGLGPLTAADVDAAILGTQYAAGGVARIGDVSGDGVPDVFAGGPGIHWSPLEGGIDAEDADLWLTPATTASGRDVPGWLPAQVGPGADPDLDADGHAEVIFAGPGLAPSGRTEAGELQLLSPAGY